MVSQKEYISVIVPTYKPADYIRTCLDSLCHQTLDQTQYEIIIVLNGPQEPYKTTIEEMMKESAITNIRLLTTEQSGVSNARNMGIDAAQGEYITFMDDDDWVSSTYLERLLAVASPNTVAISNTIRVDDTTMQESDYRISACYKRAQGKEKLRYTDVRQYFSGPCMKLFHRTMLGEDRFDTEFVVGEDSNYMMRISCRLGNIKLTQEDAIYYRRVRINSAHFKQQSLSKRLHIAWQQMIGYSKIYWAHPCSYELGFYLTRMGAAAYSIWNK